MERDGWLGRVGPWVGIGTSPAALMTGGGLGEGLKGGELVAALLTGVALLSALAIGQGVIGQRTGMTLSALTAGPLGARGSRRTASVVMLLMMIGWFGVNAGVAGVAVARLLGLPDVAGVALFAAVMLGVARVGLGALSWSALVAGVATTVLAAYGLHLAFADAPVTLSGGAAGSDPIGFAPAVVLVVGYGAAFSLRTPDFTHDLARTRQVVWCALTGLIVPLIAFALAGAALQAATGTWDLADVMRRLGSPEAAYLFVALGFTGSVLTNIWSGGLSLTDVLPRIPLSLSMPAVTVVGTIVAAGGFSGLMLPWLTVMALAAPGLAAVCAIHAARGKAASPGWGTTGLCCWGAGFGCGIVLHVAGSPMALPAAALLPAIGYWAFGQSGLRKLTDAKTGS
ncbi:MAG: cytosine permease [Thermoleophilia bacterium]|nr:cytosine permease [Thermoleophilia bacterium]